MGKTKLPTTEARHKKIQEEYEKLIKELGSEAPHITRTRIFDLLSERVNYSPFVCWRVINTKLKEGNRG